MTRLDLDFVRAQFPAFAHPATRDWVHFENAGGSYVPSQVIDILNTFYTTCKVQPYGPGGPAKVAGELMDRGAGLIGRTLNAPDGSVSIGPSTSQNTYVASHALRAGMNAGDRVIATNQDHEANIGVWRRLADTGIDVVEWQVDPETGLLDTVELAALLTDRTRLVCVTHASNLAATVNPVGDIAKLVHDAGALLAVDGVSYAPHAAIDVQALNCDLYFYSSYKTWGPHQGVMYVRPSVLDDLANQGHWFNADKAGKRLIPAGPDHAQVAALAGIVDYYDALYDHHGLGSAAESSFARIAAVFDLFAGQEAELMEPLMAYLNSAAVRMVGSTSAEHAVRAPTIAFVPEDVAPSVVVDHLAEAGIGIGHGDFYARRLVDAMGIARDEGVVRISMVHYNSTDDVARAIEALSGVLS